MSSIQSCVATGTSRSRSSKKRSRNTDAPRSTGSRLRLCHRLVVLLGLEERAEEREAAADLVQLHARLLEGRDPVDQLARGRALAQAGHGAQLEERVEALIEQAIGEIGVMHAD